MLLNRYCSKVLFEKLNKCPNTTRVSQNIEEKHQQINIAIQDFMEISSSDDVLDE